MGFLQNYLGLEPAYKDGHDLALLLPEPRLSRRPIPMAPRGEVSARIGLNSRRANSSVKRFVADVAAFGDRNGMVITLWDPTAPVILRPDAISDAGAAPRPDCRLLDFDSNAVTGGERGGEKTAPSSEQGLFRGPHGVRGYLKRLAPCTRGDLRPRTRGDSLARRGRGDPHANDSHYGLAAYVWTRDIGSALLTAHAIESGWIQVNQGLGPQPGHSYGGYKQSGIGREFSLEGMLDSFTQRKNVMVNLNTPRRAE
jgi:hypothetical protein